MQQTNGLMRRGHRASPIAAALAVGLTSLTGCAEAPPCSIVAELKDSRRGDSGCLVATNAAVLVIRHRLGGQLGIPGGAAAPGESAQCTAHRETWEETGLDVRVGRFLGRLDTGFLVYQCDAGAPPPRARQLAVPPAALAEVTGIFWADPADLRAGDWRFPDQLPAIRAMLESLERP